MSSMQKVSMEEIFDWLIKGDKVQSESEVISTKQDK